MPFPKTIDELTVAGYKFMEHAACRGPNCRATVEWWETPKGKKIPLDVDFSASLAGKVTPHWATCKDQERFRT